MPKFKDGERNYGEGGIYSPQDIIERYGIHPDECETFPNGQLYRILQIWKWSDGSLHTQAEPDHKYLECVKSSRHYIGPDNVCKVCGSSKL